MFIDDFGMSGFGLMNTLFPVLFGLVFLLVAGVILYRIIHGILQYSSNNASPILTVEARVVAKREEHAHHNHVHGDIHHSHVGTTYLATFEVQSGDRMEFVLDGREFGQLAEGDVGKLTFQGTRYLGFDRFR